MKRILTIFAIALMSFSCFCFAQDSFNGDIYDIQGSVSICLQVDGITGESLVMGHENDIDLLTWNWGMIQSGSMHVGGGGARGKAEVEDFVVTKYVDKASPQLMLACLKGDHIRKATIYVIKTGAAPLEYIVITMEDVLVASVMAGGKQDYGLTTETVSLKFARVTFSYTPQKPDGSADAAVQFTWDLGRNRR